ncbi:MAG: HAMP domain-containing histidine kinase [Bacteroidales bacterium]|nr:HAMP domain-containing histidine kinase [Bacteroidales bacterium]
MNPIVINEKVIGALFFGKDITKRKQAEQALLDSQLLLKSSLESQSDTILFSINKDYHYLYFNSAHAKVMKYAYGKEIEAGMNILDCITSDEDRAVAKNNYDRALRGETHTNVRVFGKENLAYYESFFNPILNERNQIVGATGLARDISERKKSELALLKSQKRLKDLNATKDKLFSIIAHDLRSPFNNIIGFSELLLENINKIDNVESEKYIDIINSTAKKTIILLDNLLNWAKSQTGELSYKPEKIILSEIMLEIIGLKKSLAKAKNISLHYTPTIEIELYTDINILKTILRNLISNAVKFTNAGGYINILATTNQQQVEISISDNGVGINEETIHKLFDLSTNLTSLGTANEKGSGLGLVLCKEFVEKLGGKIWVESVEGKGSDFKFTLPMNNINE